MRTLEAQATLNNPPTVESPDPYAPGGAERRRLRADVVLAVTGPDLSDEAIKTRAESLLEWIDQND